MSKIYILHYIGTLGKSKMRHGKTQFDMQCKKVDNKCRVMDRKVCSKMSVGRECTEHEKCHGCES